jgi:hypothetical protein
MILKETGNKDFESTPIGSHIARCIKFIDLGTQKSEYEGKVSTRRQVIITWELPNELMSHGEYAGKPFAISKFYTASLGEKANLRKDLENWRGRAFSNDELNGFDSANIVGKPCMVSVVVGTKEGSTKVAGVMALPKGMTCPAAINPFVHFSLEEFDAEVFNQLTPKIKEIVMASPEYAEAIGESKEAVSDESIPF